MDILVWGGIPAISVILVVVLVLWWAKRAFSMFDKNEKKKGKERE